MEILDSSSGCGMDKLPICITYLNLHFGASLKFPTVWDVLKGEVLNRLAYGRGTLQRVAENNSFQICLYTSYLCLLNGGFETENNKIDSLWVMEL